MQAKCPQLPFAGALLAAGEAPEAQEEKGGSQQEDATSLTGAARPLKLTWTGQTDGSKGDGQLATDGQVVVRERLLCTLRQRLRLRWIRRRYW